MKTGIATLAVLTFASATGAFAQNSLIVMMVEGLSYRDGDPDCR
jgi:hypothetical protein